MVIFHVYQPIGTPRFFDFKDEAGLIQQLCVADGVRDEILSQYYQSP